MLETVIAGLILALVSGLAFLAYKHPPAYRKMFLPLMIMLGLAVLVLNTWNFAVMRTHLELMDFMTGKYSETSKVVNGLMVPFGWLAIVGVVIFGYLLFLYYLPNIIGEQK